MKSTVHFSIGDGFGDLLQSIAQEHLMGSNLPKALNTLIDTGVPEEYAFDILLGVKSLDTDVETQMLSIGDRQKLLPLKSYFQRRNKEIVETVDILLTEYNMIPYRTKATLDWRDLVDVFQGKDIKEILEYNEDYSRFELLLVTTKTFIEETLAYYETWRGLTQVISKNYFVEYGLLDFYELEGVWMLKTKMDNILKKDNSSLGQTFAQESIERLEAHIKAVRDINKVKELKPTDKLMDAGWFSPEGEYYGLDGEVSNMLHNEIAEFLSNQGVIPHDYVTDKYYNPDQYLNENGWIKQHGNWLLTDAFFYDKKPTKIQITTVAKMMYQKHKVIRVGFRQREFTPNQLLMMDEFMLEKNFME